LRSMCGQALVTFGRCIAFPFLLADSKAFVKLLS